MIVRAKWLLKRLHSIDLRMNNNLFMKFGRNGKWNYLNQWKNMSMNN